MTNGTSLISGHSPREEGMALGSVCQDRRPMRVSRVRQRALGLAIFAVICVAALPDAAAAACGQDYRLAPTESRVPGGPPLAIGDSVLADAVPELAREGFEADGMVCRQMSQGLAMLEARGGTLPHLVVLALGTNGTVTPAQIDRALAILGPGRVLALVTPHGSVVASTPEVIRVAAASHPGRILLLDWDALSSEHPAWFAPDGVHLAGLAGIDAFAELIAAALPYAAPVSAEPPHSSSPPVARRRAGARRRRRAVPEAGRQSERTATPVAPTRVTTTTTHASLRLLGELRRQSGAQHGAAIGVAVAIGVAALVLLAAASSLLWRRRHA
jgi:hypothetical protein